MQRKRDCLRAQLEGRRQGPGSHHLSPRSSKAGQPLPTEALWGNTTSDALWHKPLQPCNVFRNHLLGWFFFPAGEGKPGKSLQSSSQEDFWAHFPKHINFLVGGLGELPWKVLQPLTQQGDAVHPIQTHSLTLNYRLSQCGEPGILQRPPYFRNTMSPFHTHREDSPKPFQQQQLQEPVRARTLYKACAIGVTNCPSLVGTQGFLECSKSVCSG